MTLATWGKRVLGWLVDFGFNLVVSIVLAAVSAVPGVGGLISGLGRLALFALMVYWWYLTGRDGQSFGKKVIGIKVLDANTGQTIGGGRGIIRAIAHIVDGIICGIGYLFPLWDAKKQTIADKIIGTVVVEVPTMPFAEALKSSLPKPLGTA
jgi:uncharacterized RDD family membrane protein YckC